MDYFEYISGGIRKHHSWGYVDILTENPADGFSPEEQFQLAEKMGRIENDLSQDDKDTLNKVRKKLKERKKWQLPLWQRLLHR